MLAACSACAAPHTEPGAEQSTGRVRWTEASEIGEVGPLIPFHKDAIHASVVWNRGGPPRICFAMRPSEYRGTDLVNPQSGTLGTLRSTFEQLVYGGFSFSRTLDDSVRTRITADIARDNVQCFDLSHPDAFRNRGLNDISLLTPDDFALNAAAFTNAGHAGGLQYNVFCSGNVSLADGRLLFIGGHDKGGNNGIRKLNIFDPATDTWRARAAPLVRTQYLADPTGEMFQHVSALDERNTDPADPSDMRYQRWYPTGVTLPDGRVLILSGSDQDTSVGPDLAASTKVRQATPEVYDPVSDRSVALENARRLFMMYPRSYVVQTGPGWNDWGVAAIGEVQPPLPTGSALRSYDPYRYNGNTYLLDVRGALADPLRETAASNHWRLVATASIAHDSGAGASLVTLNRRGLARSQRVVLFGGGNGAGSDPSATVEMIDYEDPQPRWVAQQSLNRAVDQNLAVALPDGTVLVMGGRSGDRDDTNEYDIQLFDPRDGSVRSLAHTHVPRHDHATALLMPDASVVIMGGNRVELVPGNRDAGVPVAQVYRPPYLFRDRRPVIESAPDEVRYGSSFDLEVHGHVQYVSLMRIGPVTHNWDWGNRHVRLAADQHAHTVTVQAPALPGLAVPGIYMLFAVSWDGVPSEAVRVQLR